MMNENPNFQNAGSFENNTSENTEALKNASHCESQPKAPPFTGDKPLPGKAVRESYTLGKNDVIMLFVLAALTFLIFRIGVFFSLGLGFAAACTALVIAVFAFVYDKNAKGKAYYSVLFLFMLLLSGSFFFNSDPLFKLLDIAALFVIGVMCYSGISGNTVNRDGSCKELFESLYYTVIKTCEKLFVPFYSMRKSTKNKKNKTAVQIALGLVVSIPILLIITLLLSTYDGAFESLIEKLFESFDIISFLPALALTVIITPFIYSFSLVLKKKNTNGADLKMNSSEPKGSAVVFNTFLAVVSAVYVLYLFSQLAYVTSTFSFLLPEGYSESQFAREGFFQMLLIAAINLLITAVTSIAVKRNEKGNIPALTKAFNVFLCLFTLFFTASAFAGIARYISKYGFTYLRTVSGAFTVMAACIVVIMLISLFVKKLPIVRLVTLVVALTLVVMSYFNVDSFVSKANLKLFEEGEIKLTASDVYMLESGEMLELIDSGLYESIARDEDFSELEDPDDIYCNEFYEWINTLYITYSVDKETGKYTSTDSSDILCLSFKDISEIKKLEKGFEAFSSYEKEQREKYCRLLEEKGYICVDEEKGVYYLYDEYGEIESVKIVTAVFDGFYEGEGASVVYGKREFPK